MSEPYRHPTDEELKTLEFNHDISKTFSFTQTALKAIGLMLLIAAAFTGFKMALALIPMMVACAYCDVKFLTFDRAVRNQYYALADEYASKLSRAYSDTCRKKLSTDWGDCMSAAINHRWYQGYFWTYVAILLVSYFGG